MRPLLTCILLFAVSACSRSHAPAQAASAMAPAPASAAAQAVPAGASPEAKPVPTAAIAQQEASGVPAAANLKPAPGAVDSRWVNVDPNQLEAVPEPALAEFQADQRQRDAELLQRDAAAAEAPRHADRLEPDPRNDDRRYAEDGRRYREEDDRYGPPPELPPYDEEGDGYDEPPPYDEPPSYDEGDEEYDPALDEDYDPREDEGYRGR